MSYHSLRRPDLYERPVSQGFATQDCDSDLTLCPRCDDPMDYDGSVLHCLQCERRAKTNADADERNEAHINITKRSR